MAADLVFRTCTLCEAGCGLAFEVEGGRVVSARPDPDDPFSKGHVCPKGIALPALHHDPDRLRQPLRRTGPWQKVARAHPGVSANDWTDSTVVESVVGQSVLNGVPVRLRPLATAAPDPN